MAIPVPTTAETPLTCGLDPSTDSTPGRNAGVGGGIKPREVTSVLLVPRHTLDNHVGTWFAFS